MDRPLLRRHFLSTATASVLAAPFLSPLAAQEPDANPAKPAPRARANQGLIYKSLKTNGNPSRKRLQEFKDLGFDGIESSSPGVKDIAALKKDCADVGLHIHGVVDMVHWKQRLSSPDADVRTAGRKVLEQAVRDSHALGGSSVLLVPGVVDKTATHEECAARSIEEISKVVPTAAWYGQHILIETVWNNFCTTPESFRDYLDDCNSPWVKAYYDIGNMQKFAPSHEWIRVLGDRIIKMDVKDWGKKPGFCPLGKGDVDWPEVRKAIKEINFTGWVTREGNDGGVDKTAALMDELLDL